MKKAIFVCCTTYILVYCIKWIVNPPQISPSKASQESPESPYGNSTSPHSKALKGKPELQKDGLAWLMLDAEKRVVQDPIAAMTWALNLKHPSEKMCAVHAILTRVSLFSSSEKAGIVMRIKSEDHADLEWSKLATVCLKGWIAEEPVEVLDWVRNSGLDCNKLGLLPELIQACYKKDPEETLGYMKSIGPGVDYNLVYLNICKAMGPTNLNSALNYAASFPDDPNFRSHCIAEVAECAVEGSFDSSFASYNSMQKGEFRDSLGRALAKAMIEKDPIEGLRFVYTQDLQDKQEAIVFSATVMSRYDPAKVGSCIEQLPDDASKGLFTQTFCREWASYSPKESAVWLRENVSEESSRNEDLVNSYVFAGSSVAEAFIDENPVEAREWIQRLPQGDIQDAVIRNVIRNNVLKNLSDSFDLASFIQNSEIRLAQYRHVIEKARKSNPGLVESLLGSPVISSVEKEKLLDFK